MEIVRVDRTSFLVGNDRASEGLECETCCHKSAKYGCYSSALTKVVDEVRVGGGCREHLED